MKKKDFLKKMGNWKQNLTTKAGFSAGLTKGQLHKVMQAKLNKKKLPSFKPKEHKKDPKFAKMTMEEYEAKYL